MSQSIILSGQKLWQSFSSSRTGLLPRPELERSVFSELHPCRPPCLQEDQSGVTVQTLVISPLPCAITLGLQFMSDKRDSSVTRPGGDEGSLVIL